MAKVQKPWIYGQGEGVAVNVQSGMVLLVREETSPIELVIFHINEPEKRRVLGLFDSSKEAREALNDCVNRTSG